MAITIRIFDFQHLKLPRHFVFRLLRIDTPYGTRSFNVMQDNEEDENRNVFVYF